jgi:hypothetical protein
VCPWKDLDLKDVSDSQGCEPCNPINNRDIRDLTGRTLSELTADSSTNSFPILRLVAGLIFLLSGLFVLYKVNLGLSFALVFVIAGVAVLAIGFLGHRARGFDIALLVIALIIFAGVASTYSYPSTSSRTYTATKSDVNVSRIAIDASTDFGSISIKFSQNADLCYTVTFGQTAPVFPFSIPIFGNASNAFSNVTSDGILTLNATSGASNITITLGPGYLVSMNASAGTGSIDLNSNVIAQRFGPLYLSTGTGSISAHIDSLGISGLQLQTGTGSISLDSNYLSPSASQIPVRLTTGTGSLSFNVKFPNAIGVNLNASNGFGSISKNLPGFQILQSSNGELRATEGNLAGTSFEVSLSVGTGSVSIDASLVNPVP